MQKISQTDRRLQLLINRHQSLDAEADELSTQPHLSPAEYSRLKELKIMRLKAKRAIDRFELNIFVD